MTYIQRFGSLRRAYQLIGYRPDTFKIYDARREALVSRAKLAAELTIHIQARGRSAIFNTMTGRLTVAPGLIISIFIIRCQRLTNRSLRWPVRRNVDLGASQTLAVRMQENNVDYLDFHLLRTPHTVRPRLTFRKARQAAMARFRSTTVETAANAIVRKAGPLV